MNRNKKRKCHELYLEYELKLWRKAQFSASASSDHQTCKKALDFDAIRNAFTRKIQDEARIMDWA